MTLAFFLTVLSATITYGLFTLACVLIAKDSGNWIIPFCFWLFGNLIILTAVVNVSAGG